MKRPNQRVVAACALYNKTASVKVTDSTNFITTDMDIGKAGPSVVKTEPKEFVYKVELFELNEDDEVDDEFDEFMYKSEAEDESDQDDNDSSSSWNEDSEIEETRKRKQIKKKKLEVVKKRKKAEPVEVVVKWLDDPSSIIEIPFTEQPGLQVLPHHEARPIDFFYLLADDNFFEMLCTETNLRAEEIFLEKPEGRISNWRYVTTAEMKIFLGLLFHMGTIQSSRIEDYWKTHRLFGIPCFHKYLKRNRFLLILKCFHFEHSAAGEEPVPDDHLFKVRPIINFFNEKMEQIYTPHKQLFLDEPMVLHRGKLLLQRCIKKENHNYGFKKLYTLIDSAGLIVNFALCTGIITNLGGAIHTSNIVLNLMQNKLNKGYSLHLDKFYASFRLATQLLGYNTYCTGKLHPGRSAIPDDVTNAKLNPGESICRYAEGVCIAKWNDKRDYLYISTEHSNELVRDTNYNRDSKHKPKALVEFNKYIPSADHQEQMMSYYPFSRKTLGWYKKLGFHVIHMMVFNAFVLYNKYSSKKLQFYDFRLSIVENLLPGDPNATTGTKKKRPNETILEHFPTKCTKNNQGRAMRRRCKLCFSNNIRRDTQYLCGTCEGTPGLCLEPCFRDYHETILK